MFYDPSIWMVKLSLFLLLLEAFGTLPRLRLLVYLGIIVTGLFYLWNMIAMVASCVPRYRYIKFDYLSTVAAPRNNSINT